MEKAGGQGRREGNDTKLLEIIHTASVVQTDEAHVSWGP